MCQALLHDPRFFTLLLQIDHELAAQTQAKGCSCSGALHRADYPRKPRGCPAEVRGSVQRRLSFCCQRCRTRTTPPSVHFFGRHVYLSLVVEALSRMEFSSRLLVSAVRTHERNPQ